MAVLVDDGSNFGAERLDAAANLLERFGGNRSGVRGDILRQVEFRHDRKTGEIELLDLEASHQLVVGVVARGDGRGGRLPKAPALLHQPQLMQELHGLPGLTGRDLRPYGSGQALPIVAVVLDGQQGAQGPRPPVHVIAVLPLVQDGIRGSIQGHQIIEGDFTGLGRFA